jgi:hypothetical protein
MLPGVTTITRCRSWPRIGPARLDAYLLYVLIGLVAVIAGVTALAGCRSLMSDLDGNRPAQGLSNG